MGASVICALRAPFESLSSVQFAHTGLNCFKSHTEAKHNIVLKLRFGTWPLDIPSL